MGKSIFTESLLFFISETWKKWNWWWFQSWWCNGSKAYRWYTSWKWVYPRGSLLHPKLFTKKPTTNWLLKQVVTNVRWRCSNLAPHSSALKIIVRFSLLIEVRCILAPENTSHSWIIVLSSASQNYFSLNISNILYMIKITFETL